MSNLINKIKKNTPENSVLEKNNLSLIRYFVYFI